MATNTANTDESLEDLDQIMNEIEELQQGMTAPAVEAKAPLRVVEAPEGEPVHVTEETSEVQEDALKEFHAGKEGSSSIEETLADLKDDESVGTGTNLIDQAIEAERKAMEKNDETQVEAVHEDTHESEEPIEEARPPKRRARGGKLSRSTSTPPPLPVHSGEASGSVDLTLSGHLGLRLRYEYEGQEVIIGFSDGSLHVEMSDGTEFKIPVRRPLKNSA